MKAKQPITRLGPRPLALHLSTAMASMMSSLAALPSARNGSLPWQPELEAAAGELAGELGQSNPEQLFQAVAGECQTRLSAMMAGVEAYQTAKRPDRHWAGGQEVWRQGTTRLLDYGGEGRPVLFVPSLVNGAQVLDLTRDRGLLGWLRRHGHRPFLVDWGAPGEVEEAFSLDDYICHRLSPALDALQDRIAPANTKQPALVGYCMGGNLALALALRRPDDLSGLALLAMPWDFHAGGQQWPVIEALAPGLENILQSFGALPVDILQALFAALDPGLAQRKFRHFASLDPDSAEAAHFVALEDWVNDGVPLAAQVARDCLLGWYGENSPAQGKWSVDGRVVDPTDLPPSLPVLVAIPENDRIVPAASAQVLADAIGHGIVIRPTAGHIGMVVGRRGKTGLWQPLSKWLLGLDP
jgi:polyhydroxyalkanoate synthase subunit PhaC